MVVLGGGAVSYERGTLIDSGLVGPKAGEVSRGERMLYSGTDPESYITEYTLVNEENTVCVGKRHHRLWK